MEEMEDLYGLDGRVHGWNVHFHRRPDESALKLRCDDGHGHGLSVSLHCESPWSRLLAGCGRAGWSAGPRVMDPEYWD